MSRQARVALRFVTEHMEPRDDPEWCSACLLPSVDVTDLFGHYEGAATGPALYTVRHCASCGAMS